VRANCPGLVSPSSFRRGQVVEIERAVGLEVGDLLGLGRALTPRRRRGADLNIVLRSIGVQRGGRGGWGSYRCYTRRTE